MAATESSLDRQPARPWLAPPTASAALQIPALDGFRAVAALLVFLAHAGWGHVIPGGFGVTIFFFLSGYLITTLLRREFEHAGRVHFGRFYLRRALRLFPPLYIVLGSIGALCAWGWVASDMTRAFGAGAGLYWTNYQYLIDGRGHFVPFTSMYWSLAIEEHFYLFFPLLFALLARRLPLPRVATWLLLCCALALAWRLTVMLAFGASEQYTYRATDTRFDSLLFGCIMGVWCNPVLDARDLLRPSMRWVAGGVALLAIASTMLIRDELFRGTVRYTIQGLALFVVFWVAIRHPGDWTTGWLNATALRWLGVLSYTFYLSHMFCLHLADRILGPDASAFRRAPLAFVLTLAVCAAMYRWVERPLASYRQRLRQA